MRYKVQFTQLALEQLNGCYLYILFEFNDTFAAESFRKDAADVIKRLEKMADGFLLCEDAKLREYGYRVIHFKKHRYKMVYLINGDTVEIHGVYHNLQSLEKHVRG